MKTLTLIRHAKSSWGHGRLEDIDRPLNKRGLINARVMGKQIRKQGVFIDAFYSNTARRAIRTAELIAGKVNFEAAQIQPLPAFYTVNYEELLSWLRSLDNSIKGCKIEEGHLMPDHVHICISI